MVDRLRGRDHVGIAEPIESRQPSPGGPGPETELRWRVRPGRPGAWARGSGGDLGWRAWNRRPGPGAIRRHWRADRGPLRRSRTDRLVAGLAAGLSKRLGIDVTLIRVLLVLSALASGFGVAGYVLGWLLVPAEGSKSNIGARVTSDVRGIALTVALVPALVASLVLASALGAGYLSSITWALFLSAAGLVLVYRNAEDDERVWLRNAAEPFIQLGSASTRRRRSFALRVAAGVLLAAGGLFFLVLGHSSGAALRPLGGAALVIAAIVVLFGPWWLRLARDLVSERQARVRAEERADMAARVHDSVLQTLAMIQRAADQPQQVAQLARTQERELRSWLFEGGPPASIGADGPTTMLRGVQQIEAEVETAHGVAVDAVTVGDCPLDDDIRALLAAGKEATVNAAKWSGAPTVSIFVEVESKQVSLFVRDRGVGFDPAGVAGDRRGIAESVRGRMIRHGGTAAIRSAAGQGTEVELTLPRRGVRA